MRSDDFKPHTPTMNYKKLRLIHMLREPRTLLTLLRQYVGLERKPEPPIADRAALQRFLETRASFVAQTSLYGYLRTRAGTRYPELFDDDGFAQSINIAKWQIWLACLSDLSVYAGGLLAQHSPATAAQAGRLLCGVADAILASTGVPPDAGPEFSAHAERLRQRLAGCDWLAVADDESPFSESPDALVYWAPVIDDLKQYDEAIVRNSIRFRWQETRRALRELLRPEALLATPT